MSLRSSTPSFPHVFSAIGLRTDQPQAEAGIQVTRMDPGLKHSGVTDFGVRILYFGCYFPGGKEWLRQKSMSVAEIS